MFARLLLAVGGIAAAGVASAQEPIRFARTPDISADGKTVVFSYLGDLWSVETIGGVARPITMHEAHDYFPCLSPDGRRVAFASNRHGSYDVFVVPVVGGKPKRLTFDSAADTPLGWTPDGKNIVFASTRSQAYPASQDVWLVPADGGQERRLDLFDGKEAYFAPDGKRLAFVRGPGLWYRRGYRGSSNDDIWLANADGSSPMQLTTFNGQDVSPMWSPDGAKLYYVSEDGGSKTGCANIVVRDVAPPSAAPPTPLTHHTDDSVRRAKLSGNGDWIVYECGADLWVVSTKGGSPRKLAIEVHADDKSNADRVTTFTRDATEYAFTPDESHAVVVVHGELFLTKLPAGGKATRLTDHPAFDHAPTFSPDGKKLLFASDRSGVEELYMLEADDAEHPEFTKAHKFKTTKLTSTADEETGASFAPKGERIAFLRAGQLWTMKPDGTDAKILVADKQVFDYDWSPDGKFVAFARLDGGFASEVYIVPTDGSEPPKNVSRYATWNADVSWSSSGGKLAFVSERRGTPAMHVLPLQRPSADGSPPSRTADIEWDDIHLRVERAAPVPAVAGTVSPDGSQVAFRSPASGDDLWVAATDGKTLQRITSGNQGPRLIKWAKKSSGTVYFLNRDGELRYARAGSGFGGPVGGSISNVFGGGGDSSRVPFQCKLTINREEEFAEMFAQSWRALSDNFYDETHHGAKWPAVREKYAGLVSHVGQREDLYAMVSLMLGELNASHLGIGGRLPVPDEQTADLGLLFDEKYAGPGLKVAEILKRGPADKRNLGLKPGDIVLAVDRTPLTAATNLSKLLNNKANETVLLDVTSAPADPKAKRRIEVTATTRDKVGELMYDRWVAANAAQVSKLSNGRLAYIHIPGMDENGLESFVRGLYSDAHDKDGVVLDVRFNGGGFTHDQVLNYLSGKEHTTFRQRNGGAGFVLRSADRKWSKPAAVLINNRSYSDAEIFPHAFRASGLGKVVGQATGGHVIGTNATRLIDGSQFRLPRIGVFTDKGVNMEKEGVAPDVAVDVKPADWARGVDTQLAEAVKVVQTDVVAWRKAKGLPDVAAAVAAPVKAAGGN